MKQKVNITTKKMKLNEIQKNIKQPKKKKKLYQHKTPN